MSFYKLPARHKEVMSIVTSDFWLTEPHMPFRSWFVLNLFRFHDTSCPSIPCGWVAFILIIFYHSSLLYSLLLIVLLSSLSQVNLLNHGPHRFKFWHAWIDLSLTSNTNLVAYYNIWTIFFIDLGLVGIIFRLASNTNLVTIILLSEGAIYLSQFDYTLRASTSNITLAASSQWRQPYFHWEYYSLKMGTTAWHMKPQLSSSNQIRHKICVKFLTHLPFTLL